MSEFAGRISRPRPERAGVCNATRLATRLPNGLPPAAENDYALSFNGVDQFMSAALPTVFTDIASNDCSVSLWFKADDLSVPSPWIRLFEAAYDVDEFIHLTVAPIGKPQLYVNDPGGNYQAGVDSVLNTGQWYHIVGVWDASENDAKLYLDGVLQSGAGQSGAAWGGTQSLYLAKRGDGGFYTGELDEVSIWDVALDADAVTAVYNSGRPIDLNYGRGDYDNSADLVSWWRMGDINLGGGETVPDAAGSNDGTLENEPAYTVDNPPNYSNWALGFDGVDQYGTSAGDATLASKSYSFWSKSTLDGSNGVFDHGDERTGALVFNWSYPHISLGENYYRAFDDSPKQHDGEWHHWVAYIDPNPSNCKMYVDGVALGVYATDTSGSANAYTTGLTIGRASASYYFDGSLDEFAIFDGELTNAQVNEIFRAGKPGTLDGMSPEHWFRMGENNAGEGYTVTDMGSESDDLTIYNTPTFERSVPAGDASWNNRSIGFDGVDQYVEVNNIIVAVDDPVTCSAWVYLTATPGEFDQVICIYGTGTGTGRAMGVNDDRYLTFNTRASDLIGTTALSEDTWYHIAATCTDGGAAILYINGIQEASGSVTYDDVDGSETRIGRGYVSEYIPAKIDEVGVWSSVLTAGQILEIYNGGIPFDLSGYSPAAWYRMGDGDNPGGTTITDRAGQNNGTTENSPTWSSDTP